jgi:hypothetical protein
MGSEAMGDGPIFIGGLSFCGKTQLRLLLSAHPNVSITRHTSMWPRFYNRFGNLSRPKNLEHCLQAMLNDKHVKPFQPDPEYIRMEFVRGPATYSRLFALIQGPWAKRQDKRRWGDQLGFIERYAEPIFTAYPSARIIHMVRQPTERAERSISTSSYRRGKVGWETAWWLRSIRLASQNRNRYSDRYLVIRFEDLLTSPEATLRKICSFVDEEFDPAMLTIESGLSESENCELEADANPKASFTLTERERVFVQAWTGHEMRKFGYAKKYIWLSLKDWFVYLFIDWPLNLAGMAAGLVSESRRS